MDKKRKAWGVCPRIANAVCTCIQPCALPPDRLPLGVTDSWMWSRGLNKAADQANPDVNESCRWVKGYERVAEMAAHCPEQRLVYVADRESDFYGVLLTSKMS